MVILLYYIFNVVFLLVTEYLYWYYVFNLFFTWRIRVLPPLPRAPGPEYFKRTSERGIYLNLFCIYLSFPSEAKWFNIKYNNIIWATWMLSIKHLKCESHLSSRHDSNQGWLFHHCCCFCFLPPDPQAANRSGAREPCEPIPSCGGEEERQDGKLWRTVMIGEQEHRINMKSIEPYQKVISHGGGARAHTHTHTHTYGRMHTHMHACTWTHAYTWTHTNMHTHARTYAHTYTVYIHTHTHIHTYIHTYIHTPHTHKHTCTHKLV